MSDKSDVQNTPTYTLRKQSSSQKTVKQIMILME